MGEELYELLMKKVRFEKYEAGETVCKYGEIGNTFYIILTGRVNILVPKNNEQGKFYLEQ